MALFSEYEENFRASICKTHKQNVDDYQVAFLFVLFIEEIKVEVDGACNLIRTDHVKNYHYEHIAVPFICI